MPSASSGRVICICIAARGAQPLREVAECRALPGVGLEGDRYFARTGTFIKGDKLPVSQEVSLIEQEAIEAVAREHSISLSRTDSRRNIVTAGIALNELVGKEFTVGSVRMRGIKLCHPCDHLERLTSAGVKKALENRGGLRAQIRTEGVVRVGDEVIAVGVAEAAPCA